ncbi:MAG: aldehyde ferredoxin oxidoreductase family protein [Dehalococcoidia bacterium]|nr:aldehyde ferredoxin oxidoreductase family protein [Dehalococcoidia bacterium]
MNPYSGKCLAIDLTNRKTEVRELPQGLLRDYLGGAGLGARLLVEWSRPGADALSPDNPIVFACGGLLGTMAPASACHAVVTKSPLTGLPSSSVSSGLWSLALKRTGFDAAVITGAASYATYLFIDDDQVHFRKADFLMGKGCLQTEAAIRQRMGDSRVQVASIGPAGESLVRFATIKDGYRLPHRGGAGAVMGAKKLKAIAVRGTRPVSVPDISKLQKACADINALLHKSAASAGQLSPAACLVSGGGRCALPARNFQQSIAEGAGSLAAECSRKDHFLKAIACPACPVACQHVYRVTEDPHSDDQVVLQEEALAALGPLCGMYHLPVILKAIELCQFYGLDPVSAGACVAWAMECFERGLLSSKDTQGLDLSFGSADGVVETIRRIGQRKDVGDLLAEGVKRASAKLGQGSEHWAMQVRGLEFASCDPRGAPSLALGLAAGLMTPGLDSNEFPASGLKDEEDLTAAADSIGICRNARLYFRDFPAEAAQLYTLATGTTMDPASLRRAGERINNLTKAFNIREGWQQADDRLPPRLFKEPVDARAAVSEKDLKAAIDNYYRTRGWNADGLIPREKLKALGMDDIQEILKGNWHGTPSHTV